MLGIMPERQLFIVTSKGIRGAAVVAVQEIQADPVMQVIIKPYRKNKSAEQLGYLWAGVLPSISKWLEETGKDQGQHMSADDLYDWFIDEYAEKRIITHNGKSKVSVKSASKMNTKEMSEFIERIIQHMGEQGFAVPLSEYR